MSQKINKTDSQLNPSQKGFVNLTCDRDYDSSLSQEATISTHDLAETMIYSFVDNTPHVADLLWTKQQLGQNGFLTLAADMEHEHEDKSSHSTHEIIKK
ncbi:unnamed protein product [Rhizopus stolonifer]